MGKSAKFYKRPSKKEKESNTLNKLIEPSAITKKSTAKKVTVPSTLFKQAEKVAAAAPTKDEDVDMTEEKTTKKEKPQKEAELPDYVDLFSGKKTYKKIPNKKRK